MSPSPSKFVAGLNPQQAEAVLQTEGPVLVLAGAGSGKTRVITQRIAYLLAKGLAPPEGILAVTFTNKAAGEMRERVAHLVGKKKASDIVISTFHSFCLRVLRGHIEHLGYRRNFSIAGDGDSRTLLSRAVDELGVDDGFSPGIFQSAISLCKSDGIVPDPDAPAPSLELEETLTDEEGRFRLAGARARAFVARLRGSLAGRRRGCRCSSVRR